MIALKEVPELNVQEEVPERTDEVPDEAEGRV